MPNQTVLIACSIAALGLVEGVVGACVYDGPFSKAAKFAFIGVYITLIFIWYYHDSSKRLYRRSSFLTAALVGVTIAAVPYYLFKTRGFNGGAKASGIFFLLVIAYCAWVTAVEVTILMLKA
jgi:hypothetical protein